MSSVHPLVDHPLAPTSTSLASLHSDTVQGGGRNCHSTGSDDPSFMCLPMLKEKSLRLKKIYGRAAVTPGGPLSVCLSGDLRCMSSSDHLHRSRRLAPSALEARSLSRQWGLKALLLEARGAFHTDAPPSPTIFPEAQLRILHPAQLLPHVFRESLPACTLLIVQTVFLLLRLFYWCLLITTLLGRDTNCNVHTMLVIMPITF